MKSPYIEIKPTRDSIFDCATCLDTGWDYRALGHVGDYCICLHGAVAEHKAEVPLELEIPSLFTLVCSQIQHDSRKL